jgi:flavin-dependent dehydrogenase
VIVLDPRRPPIDKACGEGIMPAGVALLERLGVEFAPDCSRPFRGIRWIDEESTTQADFADRSGLGVRRLALHEALAARAQESGADLRWGHGARGVRDGAVITPSGPLRGRWVVAADGLRSPMRKALGLEARPAARARFGLRRHYLVEPWADHVEVYWTDGAEAYVTPIGASQVGIAMLFEGPPAEFDVLLRRFPALAERLAGAPLASRQRGAGPLEQRARAVVRDNFMLVGDAAGYVDAITGEGLALAFQEAFDAVEAMVEGNLGRYAGAHRRTVRVPEMLVRGLLAVEQRPALRKRLLRSLSRRPALFRDMLACHTQSRLLTPKALWTLVRLGSCVTLRHA